MKYQEKMGILHITVALLFVVFSISLSDTVLFIINDDEIITLNSLMRRVKYERYLFEDIVLYKIDKFSVKIHLISNKLISVPFFFLYKKDREFLKQLLAEKVPVKSS